MRRLFLHIGHGKTGSSFLQASFGNSTDVLAEHGYDYPAPPTRVAEAAEGWKISSGNGSQLVNKTPEELPVTRDRVFFSSEGLFRHLALVPDTREKLAAYCAYHQFDAVEVLLFLRDPIPHAESSHQQMVKRGGQTNGVDLDFLTYDVPDLANAVMSRDIGGLPTTWHVYNYDRNKSDLLEIAERFLDLPTGTLARGEDRVVNRSMTAGEIELLRELNVHDKVTAMELADALCNELPQIKAEPIFPSVAVQQEMIDRQATAIAAINARLPASEHYRTDLLPETSQADTLAFTPEQLQVIARVLASKIAAQSSEIAANLTRRRIQKTRQLIRSGKVDEAQSLLARVTSALGTMTDGPAREELSAQIDTLESEVRAAV